MLIPDSDLCEFVKDLIKRKQIVHVFLTNGVKLRGTLTAFSEHNLPYVLLEDGGGNVQAVFLSNATTICPMTTPKEKTDVQATLTPERLSTG